MSKKKEIPKKSLSDLVGILDDEAGDELERILKELRRNWDLDFNKRIAEIMDMFNEGTVWDLTISEVNVLEQTLF